MAVQRLAPERAIEVATVVLGELGRTSVATPSVASGAMNQVVCFSDIGLAVRVSPQGVEHVVRRGYHVADHAGVGLALTPLCVLPAEGHLTGVFPILTPAGRDTASWVAGQELVTALHERPQPSFFLPHFDHVDNLGKRIERLHDSVFAPWTPTLARLAAANKQAIDGLYPSSPVLSHGDLHAGQVMKSGTGYLLTDFDRACLADPEADWGRIYAWHHAGELSGDAFDAAVMATGSNLRFDRVHLYGRAYALRYTAFLALHYLDDTSRGMPLRLASFAASLGLDPTVATAESGYQPDVA